MPDVDDPTTIITTLSLCTGGGGLDIGVGMACGETVRPVAYVERDAGAVAALLHTIAAGHLYAAPIWGDVGTFDAGPFHGIVDMVVAGYPCQPFSHAGPAHGEHDHRNVWSAVYRIVQAIRPPIVFLENVPGHLIHGMGTTVRDLTVSGYRVAATTIGAEDVGAPMERERVFIMAATDWTGPRNGPDPVARPHGNGRPGGWEPVQGIRDVDRCGDPHAGGFPLCWPPAPNDADGWADVIRSEPTLAPVIPIPTGRGHVPIESTFCGMVDGVARSRRHLLRMFGNGCVPIQAAVAFLSLAARLFVIADDDHETI